MVWLLPTLSNMIELGSVLWSKPRASVKNSHREGFFSNQASAK
jgi:hypothetical protein